MAFMKSNIRLILVAVVVLSMSAFAFNHYAKPEFRVGDRGLFLDVFSNGYVWVIFKDESGKRYAVPRVYWGRYASYRRWK